MQHATAPQDPDELPSLETFLSMDPGLVRAVAPESIIFAAGGTRRAGALAGVPFGPELIAWSRGQMLACYQRMFALGARHVIAPIITPKMFQERGWRQLCAWMHDAIAHEEALAWYRSEGWRVRYVVMDRAPAPELLGPAEQLEPATRGSSGPTLWYIASSSYDRVWAWAAQAFTSPDSTRAEAVRALYGADLPTASLCISFGKPIVSPDLFPPLLYDEIQCYWTQRPGYTIDDVELRRIFYDFAYLRTTWRDDKTGRTAGIASQRALWEQGQTLGVGIRVGSYWYPAPSTTPEG